VELALVQRLNGSNYGVILDNLKRFENETVKEPAPPGEEPPPPTQETPGRHGEEKLFIVEDILLQNIQVSVELQSGLGKDIRERIVIDEVHLEDVKSEEGIPLSRLAAMVVKALLEVLAEEGIKLPESVLSSLRDSLGGLESLEELGVKISEVPSRVEEATQGLEKEVEERVREEVEKTRRKAEEKLEDLFGKDKKKEKNQPPPEDEAGEERK